MPKVLKKEKKKTGLLQSEVARKGGLAVKKKYGKKYFKKLVEKRWDKAKQGSV